MNGYFYAAPDAATLEAAFPGGFYFDAEADELKPVGPKTKYPSRGVPLSAAVYADPVGDEEPELITPPSFSEPYVILSPTPVAAWADYQVEPVGIQGYA